MMSMSDDGERTCPLCAEEMDLTDQQLKPCRCGYEICVWCWHHIIDLAEKEETVGRCPACRTQYDKERIVAMAASCERVVAENNAEKRYKGPKVKPKTSSVEAKKQLSSVRVIQRNLVYIIGLPSHLCDESILERKEYFGQYGKVLKVSVSRPASSQQISSNNTFSVYITYAREEEAVRCIQSVHNYVLEGKALRACFGTTKYCHAWLRNMTCNNPDCLYLHDVGVQEDSFTKDEIISAYTRTRVPQMAMNTSQRRSGSVLPPPLDDFSIPGAGVGKSQAKISSNQSVSSQARGSPPDGAVGKSGALPTTASWGQRSLSCRPSAPCSSTFPVNSKVETYNNNNISLPSLLVEDEKHTSAWNDEVVITRKVPESNSTGKKPSSHEMQLSSKENNGLSFNKSACHGEVVVTKAPDSRSSSVKKLSLPPSMESSKLSSSWHDYEEAATSKAIESKEALQSITNQLESFKLGSWEDYDLPIKEVLVNDFGSESSAWNDDITNSSKQGHPSSVPDDNEDHKPARGNNAALMNSHLPKALDRTSNTTFEVSKNANSSNEVLPTGPVALSLLPSDKDSGSASDLSFKAFPSSVTKEHEDLGVHLPKQQFSSITGKEDPVLFDKSNPMTEDSAYHILSNHSNSGLSSNNFGSEQLSHVSVNTDKKLDPLLPLVGNEVLPFNGHKEDELSSSSVDRKFFECLDMNHAEEKFMEVGRSASLVNGSSGLDTTGENIIISDILSLDFDPWDDSLFSSNDLVQLLGEDAKQDVSSTSWKPQSSNQSRFSFAWQENQGNPVKPLTDDMSYAERFCSSQGAYGEGFKNGPIFNNFEGPKTTISNNVERFCSSQGAYGEGFKNGPIFNNFEGPKTAISNNVYNPSDSSIGTLRSKVSAPPGFSAPSKATPPGFSSHDRFNQAYVTPYTESSLLDGPLVGGNFQSHIAGNSGDLELSDPAIMMAVGKEQMPSTLNNPGLGLTPSFAKHSGISDSDPRFHLLLQQSLSSHQNMRLPEHMGERYLSVNDLFMASQLLSQNHSSLSPFDQMALQQPISSHFPDSQRDGWNGFHSGGDIRLGEIIRNDRYGLANFYSSNDEPKFHVPNGNLYNRAFGM